MQNLTKNKFELWVFYANTQLLEQVESDLIAGFVVDLEKKGKDLRQKLYNTQISEHSIEDLKEVKKRTKSNIICRINPQESLNLREIKEVLDAGADEILLPMVRSLSEVVNVLQVVDNQALVSVMLETNSALTIVEKLDKLPLNRFYVGLNDLAIENGHQNIFTPMTDGTIEKLRPKISKKFGIAGLTHPSLGYPIPCKVLLRMMLMFNCSFGILRRSFYKDLAQFSAHQIYTALLENLEENKEPNLIEELDADKIFISNAVF
ncbi:hypothetical protein BKI52_45260 [marine bacterium AO1-C]|nr:hypothetical protein BKI52_45260 [marine bacterium AO1-C]